MEGIKKILNKSKYLLVLLAVFAFAIYYAFSTKGYAASTYTINSYTFSNEIKESLPTTAGNYYLAKDIKLTSNYTLSSGTIRLYLNDHKIDLNGYQIIITGGTLAIHDDYKTRTSYSLNADGSPDFSGSDYYFTGGYITGGKEAAIAMSGGSFYLFGGTIIGNGTDSSNMYGGGICAISSSSTKVYLYGGKICCNKASYGAGIYAKSNLVSVYCQGGTIEHNIATQRGGGIWCNSKIYASDTPSSASVLDVNRKMTTVQYNYLNNYENNVHLENYNIELTSGITNGKMGISYLSSRTSFTTNFNRYVSSSVDPNKFFYDDNHTSNVVRTSTANTGELKMQEATTHTHDGNDYSTFTDTTKMPEPTTAGTYYYYLKHNMNLNSDWTINKNVVIYLCLNGYYINFNGHKCTIGGSLNIYDCKNELHYYGINSNGSVNIKTSSTQSGTFDHTFIGSCIYGASGTAFSFATGTTNTKSLNLYSGTLIKNNGGAVNVGDSYTSFHMYGGAIIGNENTTNNRASAVFSTGVGKIYLEGGYITHNVNRATTSYGAVYAASGGWLYLGKDIRIADNTYNNEYQQNIYLLQNRKIYFSSNLKLGAKLGVYYAYEITGATTSYVITTNYGNSTETNLYKANLYFKSDIANYTLVYSSSSDEVEVKLGHSHDGVDYTAINSNSMPQTEGVYYLNRDVQFGGNWTVPAGDTILCLNGHKVEIGTYQITIGEGRSLTIIDCTHQVRYYNINSETGKASISTTSGTRFENGYFIGVSTSYNNMFTVSGGTLRLENINIFNFNATLGYGAVGVGSNGTFEMEGGQIVGCKSDGGAAIRATSGTVTVNNAKFNYNQGVNQGAIFLQGSEVIFNASNITMDNNKTTDTDSCGGSIYVNLINTSTIATITDLVITNSSSAFCGGAIHVESGTLNLYNSEMQYCTASNSGGAIYNKGTIVMDDVTIKNCTSSNYGGAIYNASSKYVTLQGTVYLSNCSAKAYGGAIYNYGYLTLDGTEDIISIRNNTLTNGSYGAGIYNKYSLKVKGLVKITDNKDSSNANSNLYLDMSSFYPEIQIIADLDLNTKIYVTCSAVEKFVTRGFNKVSDKTVNYIVLDKSNGNNVLSFQGVDKNVYYGDPNLHTHDGITFSLWNHDSQLPTETGNYYLTRNVDFLKSWTIPNGVTINLCLNGKEIDLSSYTIYVYGTLNIYDCDTTVHNYTLPTTNARVTTIGSGDESFTGGYFKNSTYRAFDIESSGIVNMYAGTIIGNSAQNSTVTPDIAYCGGAILINGDNAKFNMYGGSIEGNYAKNDSGAICIYNGSANIYGGKIKNNIAGGNGGAIYLNSENGSLSIGDGAYIYGNKANGVADDIKLYGSKTIKVTSELYTGAKIGVAIDESIGSYVVTSGYKKYNGTTNPSSFFTLYNEGYDLLTNASGEVLIRRQHTHNFTITASGTTLTVSCTSDCPDSPFTTVSLTANSGTYNGSSYSATLSNIATLRSQTGLNITYSLTYQGTSGTTYSSTTTAPKNAGNYKATAVITIGSTSYTLNKDFYIQKRSVTVTGGITANNKVYDGTTKVGLNLTGAVFSNMVSGDNLTVASAKGSFSTSGVGEDKFVNVSNITLGGTSVSNYYLASTGNQNSTTANIARATITVESGITGLIKQFDGTTTASLSGYNAVITGLVGDEYVDVSATGHFEDINVANKKAIIIDTITFSGTYASNYQLATSGNQTIAYAAIFKREIIVSGITASNKTYDGTTAATLVYTDVVISNLVDGYGATITATGDFANKNVGTDKIVNIKGYSVSKGTAYYTISSSSQAQTTANITAKYIRVRGITALDKEYDGTTVATLDYSELEFFEQLPIEGDEFTVTVEGNFENVIPGENKVVNINQYTLSGKDASNYMVFKSQAQTTASITPKTVTISGIEVVDKVYDAKTTATIDVTNVIIDGNISGALISVSATATFIDANVGENKIVYLTNLEITGKARSYYQVAETGNQEIAYASITKATMTLTALKYEGDYDKEAHSITITKYPNGSVIYYSTDDVEYSTTKPEFVDAGTYIIYYKVENNNYNTLTGSQTVVINPKEVIVDGITAISKDYDGNTTVEFNYDDVIFDGLISGDELTITATGEFEDPNAEEDKVINFTNLVLGGTSGNNYVLNIEDSQTQTKASINKIDMDVTSEGYVGIYDREEHTITVSNVPEGSTVYYSDTSYFFDSTDEITFIVVGEYTVFFKVENPNYNDFYGSEDVTINTREVIVSGIKVSDKVYDGTIDADVILDDVVFEGLINGDELTISLYAEFIDENYGTNKVVNLYDLVLGGSDDFNYYLSDDSQVIAYASITKKQMDITSMGDEDIYDGNAHSIIVYDEPTDATIYYSIDDVEYSETKPEFTDAGTYKVYYKVECDNYETVTGYEEVIIHKKSVYVDTIIANDKDYDGNTSVVFDYGYVDFNGLIYGDELTITATGEFADPNVEDDKVIVFTSLVLGGASVNNYELDIENSQSQATATINKIDMNVEATGFVGTYDKEDHTITLSNVPTNSTVKYSTDDIEYSTEEITYTTAGTYTIYFIVENQNYNEFSGSVEIIINKKEVIVSGIEAINKNYDGTTEVELDLTSVVFDGIISGDSLTISLDAEFADENNGTDKIVNLTNMVLGGNDVDNYYLSDDSQSVTYASIYKILMEITAIGYEGTYDKEAHTITISNVPVGSTISYSIDSVEYSTTKPEFVNAGTYIIEYMIQNPNYNTYYGGEQVIINKKEITISNIIVNNKEYDGNVNASLDYSEVVFGGVLSGDEISVSAEAVFTDKNVGVNKEVVISNLVVSGNDNYCLATTGNQTSSNANITKKEIKVDGIKANDKVYDGNDVATLDYQDVEFIGLVEGDTLTVTATGTFASIDVANNIAVAISNLVISGADENNYYLAESGNQEVAYANIALKQLNVEVTGYEGTYDKEAHTITVTVIEEATITYSIDNVEYSTTKPEFVNAGTYNVYYKVEKDNYETVSGYETVIINKKVVTVSGITANDKDYDGNNNATLVYTDVVFDGIINGDILTITAVASFNDENASENKVVTISNLVLGGSSVNNYELNVDDSQSETLATINKIDMGLIISGYEGTYDKQAHSITISGVPTDSTTTYSSDDETYSSDVISYTNAGTYTVYYKVENINYYSTIGFKTIVINKKQVVVSGITASDTVYNGTTYASINCDTAEFDGPVEGDTLTVTAAGYYTDPNAGTNKKITLIGMTLHGSDSINYEIDTTSSQAYAYANIEKANMSVSINEPNSTYDGEYHSNTFTCLVEGTTFKYSLDGVEYSETKPEFKDAGIHKFYFIAENPNYNTVTGDTIVTINKKELTVSGIIAIDKTYDGTTNVELSYDNVVFDGIVSGDNLGVTATGVFETKNAGTNKKVLLSNIALLDETNYYLSNDNQIEAYATINKRDLSVTGIKAFDKVYDGSTYARIDSTNKSFNGLIENDLVSISFWADFDSANVGIHNVIFQTSELDGMDAANYNFLGILDELTAEITPATFGVEVTAYVGTYDGIYHTATINVDVNDAIITYSLDEVNYSSDVLSYKDAGTYTIFFKIEKENYYDFSNSTTITINKKEITISNILVNDKVYDGNISAELNYSEVVIDGVIDGEELTINATATYEDKNVGVDKVVTITDITVDSENYLLLTETLETTSSITKKQVVVSGIKANNKKADGKADATLDYSNVNIEGLVDGDTLNVKANGSFSDSLAGSDKKVIISNIELLGDDSSNYEIVVEESQKETKASIIKEETIDKVDPVDPTDPEDPENNDPVNPDKPEEKTKKNNTGLVLGIILGIVALSAVAGASVIILKKKIN